MVHFWGFEIYLSIYCRYWEDGINWSINDDDTVPQGSTLSKDYSLLYRWGFRECDFAKTVSLYHIKQLPMAKITSLYNLDRNNGFNYAYTEKENFRKIFSETKL